MLPPDLTAKLREICKAVVCLQSIECELSRRELLHNGDTQGAAGMQKQVELLRIALIELDKSISEISIESVHVVVESLRNHGNKKN